ncbi:MAG: bifunctional protein-serine/threonine kinase/phosphatase [Sulfuriflexus sp.]|nr:bifunctional protein-serine/threonine kinase/phosphatase [Sulfuriflexus sp.]
MTKEAYNGIQVGQHSDAGLKSCNEDACRIEIPEEPLLNTKGICLIIADGVSHCEAGKDASEACVNGFITDYYSTPDSWTVKTSAQKVLGSLNNWLYSQGKRSYGSAGAMLTTLSSLIIKSGTAYLFHVGDTRIYRLRDGDLECLTDDHCSWGAGEKTFLGRAMGADAHVDIDFKSLPVEIDDIYMLTTDGVHEFISNIDLRNCLRENKANPEQAARILTTMALEAGSKDNVTCQVIRVDQLPKQDETSFFNQLSNLPFPPFLDAGMTLDDYLITRELHASNRTQIYVAQDNETGKRVILKTPSVNFEDDPAYIDQFVHEEWIGKRINNPHVLKIVNPDRRRRFLYYVTEYIDGDTLQDWMRDNPRPSYIGVRDIAEQIASGLRAFHRLEMVHRDLKPANIVFDNSGRLVIIDFGSTKIAGVDESDVPFERNPMLGTMNYAAPEFFEGYTGSNRSDVFSLGVICYEILTGHLPYGGPLSLNKLKRVRYKSIKHYNQEVPMWVDAAIQKSVSLDPSKRYSRLSEFIHDLGNANPEFTTTQHEPLMQRNPIGFWRGLSAILFVFNLLLLYFLIQP